MPVLSHLVRNRWVRRVVEALTLIGTGWALGVLLFAVRPRMVGSLVAGGVLLILGALVWAFRHREAISLVLVGTVGLLVASLFAFAIPRNDRLWALDAANTPWSEVEGDSVVLHNYRNFAWRSATEVTPRWETKRLHLSQLRHVDFIMVYWGSPHICHTMVSFDFGSEGLVCVSVEARREEGETYSPLAGAFRGFEMNYVVGDERDVLRVRTNFRAKNEVYLFRLLATPAVAQAQFLDYLKSANALHEHAEWYNTITTNCSTVIRDHVRHIGLSDSWNWRLLLNGHLDERLYHLGYITRELPLSELKSRSKINAAARAASDTADFSVQLRNGLPGF